MSRQVTLTRRTLLKGGLAVGAGLTVGFYLPPSRLAALAQGAGVFAPNAWIRIDKDGIVTIINSQSEMGQGTMTSMAMIITDELEADWSKVKVEQGPASRAFDNPAWPPFITGMFGGGQLTAGSISIRGLLMVWRRAGAAAKEMLMAAAAKRWGVPVNEVVAELGVIYHRQSGRKLSYGELVDDAAQVPVPQNPTLKTKEQFRYIGKDIPRRDTPDKVTGKAIFGIDVTVPGMLIATVARCPIFGGKLANFDATKAMAVKGVRDVVQISSGLAVVADTYWAAKKGRDALQVTWDEGPNARLTSDQITKIYEEAAKQPGSVAHRDGDVTKALGEAAKAIDAVYEVPFLAHATMEPMNATAHVRPDGCDVWAPTQTPIGAQTAAMRVTGLPREKIRVHTTFLGGGFGRRGESDFVAEAVEVSKAVGAPVKVIWSREDDLQRDHYRPATYNIFRAALDPAGMPAAWLHRIVGSSILAQRRLPLRNGIDVTMVEGAENLPYDIPNLQVEYHYKEVGIPVGFWRSVGASQNAFITESFIDELAWAAGKDPYEYRRALLAKSLRHKGVLELVATKAGWGTPLPPGRHRGIAVAFSYGSWAAEVAEVSVAKDGSVRVHRVVCAIDCGFAVNPDQIKAQMEGGIVWGLTGALYGEITIENGRVQQSNFHDYSMLRINEMPVVEVHIMPSEAPPGGVGEPGVPPIAPAVANAIYAATKKRIRRLPIRPEELKSA